MLVFILASACFAADPPPDLIKRISQRETENEAARANFTYTQSVTIQEFGKNNVPGGTYKETREVVFSPSGDRSEQFSGKPVNLLHSLILTDEDFRDVREVQPFLLTAGQLFLYETKFRGEETIDGSDCWVVQVRPRQILSGQRLFDGMIWVDQRDFSILRSEGKAVPEMRTMKSENLFPHFTTLRQKVEGKYWFPVQTYADDTLPFKTGPIRIRLIIRYEKYQRFAAESTIKYAQ